MRILILLTSIFIVAISVIGDDDPAKVLVVYNTAFPDYNGDGLGDSEEAARFYADKRGVPTSNMLAVSTSNSWYYYHETGRIDFHDNLLIPILDKLATLGESNIYYILLSYGIPQKYVCEGLERGNRAVENAICIPHAFTTLDSTDWPSYWISNYTYFEGSPTIGSDVGHFAGTETYLGGRMFLVTRLDGISVERSKELVERALYGELYFYPDSGYYGGTMFVDYRYGPFTDLSAYPFSYNSYAEADSCMAKASEFILATGWPLREEPYDKEIGETGAEFLDGTDATWAASAIGYGGWYNYNTYHDAWEWKVGAFACDLNSNSAYNIRNGTTTFLANSFRLGLTCGVGCIAEPYLTGHARPEIFVYYMINGFNFAEASYLSQPVFKWMGIHVGDPIYNPHIPGKTPVIDDVPPPEPEVAVGWRSDSLILNISIDTWGREPDLVKTRVAHGLCGGELTDTVDYGRVHCMWEEIAIVGYSLSENVVLAIDVVDPVGNRTALPTYCWLAGDSGILGIDEQISSLPDKLSIMAYPNPFNSAVTIALDIPVGDCSPVPLSVEIYDVNGRKIAQSEDIRSLSGAETTFPRNSLRIRSGSEFVWHPDESLPSGIYLVRATVGEETVSKRVVYLK